MTHRNAPKFQEEYSAKLPALALLTNLGWTFLPPEQALAARNGRTDEVVLRKVLRGELKKRTFTFARTNQSQAQKIILNTSPKVMTVTRYSIDELNKSQDFRS